MDKLFDCVVYHSPCNDGSAAAWVVNLFHKLQGKDIELIPCKASDEPIYTKLIGKRVLFVDICPRLEYILVAAKVTKEIQIIDHHKTNYEAFESQELPNNVKALFDMGRSGCQLAWKYYSDEPEPWFISYIGAYDIWDFSLLPNVREIYSGMAEYHLFSFAGYQAMYENLSNDDYFKRILEHGKIELEKRNKIIQYVIDNKKIKCNFRRQYNVWLFTCSKHLISDVGHNLMNYAFSNGKFPDFTVGLIYYTDEYEKVSIHMRSDEFGIDVGELCRSLGGGGHRNAASCIIYGYKNLLKLFPRSV